jgi:hypothetical protein
METNDIKRPPRFANEGEESEWWAANPEFVLQEFERAKAEGRLGHGTVMRLAAERRAASGRVVALDAVDIEIASKLAERKGIEREAYLKELVHTALLKEAESLDQSSAA